MDSKKSALSVAGVIFLIISVFHLIRAIFQTEVVVGTVTLPVWPSVAGAVVFFLLSLWMFKSIR
ncbi:MAG: hypothetical protein HYS55_06355 [Candidatus Omnitrophica bacterium]|nr:hypothetical protein [Candidatus Omnitrophota bacterium]